MKYSVLLPTRNGGKYLRTCVDSVLSQDHDDFELIISDNANTDETAAIIDAYRGRPRVQAIRIDKPVGVTENWNRAYSASSGDYTLMIGDDDLLLPGYFPRMDALLERHSNPDLVIYNGYSFVAPGSIGGDSRAFYTARHFHYASDLQEEQELRSEKKLSIVRDMFHWKMRIPLNMQTALVSRCAAERICGGFYQPPFPDHYALNALLVMDARCVFTPESLIVVGVSPKSFGHFVYSGKQDSGLAYLGIDPEFPGELPGSPLLNGTHVWLNRLLERYPSELRGISVDRGGYIRRQVYNWIVQKRFGRIGWADLANRFHALSAADWTKLASTVFDRESWRRLASMALKPSAQAQWQHLRPLDDVQDIGAFADWLIQHPVVHT